MAVRNIIIRNKLTIHLTFHVLICVGPFRRQRQNDIETHIRRRIMKFSPMLVLDSIYGRNEGKIPLRAYRILQRKKYLHLYVEGITELFIINVELETVSKLEC